MTAQATTLTPLDRAVRLYAAEEFLFLLGLHPAFADKKAAIDELRQAIDETYEELVDAHRLTENEFGLKAEAWLKEQGLDDADERGIGEATIQLHAQVAGLASAIYGKDMQWDAEKRVWFSM